MYFLWGMVALYAVGRISQLYANRLPTLAIVILHVVPPALFAIAHGSVLYGRRGTSIFAAFCVGFGSIAELLSLRTGFPFGHYHFTDVMGPKVLGLPVLLALAYLGIGYVSWILALLILGYDGKPLQGARIASLPLLASMIMTAWDLSMEPDWATLDRAWIWHQGGAYFGVPISNFFGWFGTAYAYYLAFALYRVRKSPATACWDRRFWMPAILLYAICAIGNALILALPMAPAVVHDASGKQWLTADILACCVLISGIIMMPFAVLAWLRLRELFRQRSFKG